MGHKDDGKKTFGPGHQGWYDVHWSDDNGIHTVQRKGKSAFEAAQAAGKSLSECMTRPITCPECIYELEHGEPVSETITHQCQEDDE